MNVIVINDYVKVIFDDGTSVERHEATPEVIEKIKNNLFADKDTILQIMAPEYGKAKNILDNVEKSQYIVKRGQSFYIPAISELTMPIDFVEAFLGAELNKDQDKITAYYNFWTLVSLNPDSRVRNNLFWFLKKWGMVISKSGLIVGYRNVDIKQEGSKYSPEYMAEVSKAYAYVKYVSKQNPANYGLEFLSADHTNIFKIDDDYADKNLAMLYKEIVDSENDDATIYTDYHSHTFEIRLGHIVSMPRSQCDDNQEHTCSHGLHVANKGWLEQNYFGKVGLRVLVNPADCVGIPTQDNYGKMRVCAYYPVNVVDYDVNGHIIDQGIDSGFEDDFINKICYTGEVNNEDNDNYTLNIPGIVEIDKEMMISNLRRMWHDRQ